MRILIVASYVIKTIFKDKRNVAILVVAPTLILTLFYYLFPDSSNILVGTDNIKKDLQSAMQDNEHLKIVKGNYSDDSVLKQGFDNKKLDIYISEDEDNNIKIVTPGQNPGSDYKALSVLQLSFLDMQKNKMLEIKDKISDAKKRILAQTKGYARLLKTKEGRKAYKLLLKTTGKLPSLPKGLDSDHKIPEITKTSIYNVDSMIYSIVPYLIEIFVLFLVFLIAGIYFLRERLSGTLQRVMFSPLSTTELVLGYVFGFGVIAIFQVLFIMSFVNWGLGINILSKFFPMLFISIIMAFIALSLSILLSGLAANEFQMIQFIPMVIIPQVFLSNIFNMQNTPFLDNISKVLPLRIACQAAVNVLIKQQSLLQQSFYIGYLLSYVVIFILLSIIILKNK